MVFFTQTKLAALGPEADWTDDQKKEGKVYNEEIANAEAVIKDWDDKLKTAKNGTADFFFKMYPSIVHEFFLPGSTIEHVCREYEVTAGSARYSLHMH